MANEHDNHETIALHGPFHTTWIFSSCYFSNKHV